jgi:hypothetical protein
LFAEKEEKRISIFFVQRMASKSSSTNSSNSSSTTRSTTSIVAVSKTVDASSTDEKQLNVYLIWDFENVAPPHGTDLTSLLTKLQAEPANYGIPKQSTVIGMCVCVCVDRWRKKLRPPFFFFFFGTKQLLLNDGMAP